MSNCVIYFLTIILLSSVTWTHTAVTGNNASPISTCNCIHFTGQSDKVIKNPTFCAESSYGDYRTYKSNGGQWLFFDSRDSTWNVDNEPLSGQMTVVSVVYDSAPSPERITGFWKVGKVGQAWTSVDNKGRKDYDMKVHCGKGKFTLSRWAIGLIVGAISGLIVGLLNCVKCVLRSRSTARSTSIAYSVATQDHV